jgi:hypothetical protein
VILTETLCFRAPSGMAVNLDCLATLKHLLEDKAAEDIGSLEVLDSSHRRLYELNTNTLTI